MGIVKYGGAAPSAQFASDLLAAVADGAHGEAAEEVVRDFFHTGGSMNVALATLDALIAESDAAQANVLRAVAARVRNVPPYWENMPSGLDDLVHGGAAPDPTLLRRLIENLQAGASAEEAYDILCRFAKAGGWLNVARATLDDLPRFEKDAVNETVQVLRDWVGAISIYHDSAFFYDGALIDSALRDALSDAVEGPLAGENVRAVLHGYAAAGVPMNVALVTLDSLRHDKDEEFEDCVLEYMDLVIGWCAVGRGIYEKALPIKVPVPNGFYRAHRHAVEDWFYDHGIVCCPDYFGYRFRDESDAEKFRIRWL